MVIRSKHFLVLLSLLFCITQIVIGQSYKKDSLLTVLKTQKEDTSKVITLDQLLSAYRKIPFDSALLISQQILKLSKKLNFIKGQSLAYFNFGAAYNANGKKDSALSCYKKAVVLALEVNLKLQASQLFRRIAGIYTSSSDYPKATEAGLKALQLAEEVNDKKALSDAYNGLGNTYYFCNKYPNALESHKKALQLRQELKNELYISHSYLNIGNVFNNLHEFDSAFFYYAKALEIQKRNDNPIGQAYTLGNIGVIFLQQKNYRESISRLELQAKMLDNTPSEEYTRAQCLVNLARAHSGLNNYDAAKKIILESVKLCEKNKFKQVLSLAYLELSNISEKQNQMKEALSYYKQYKTLTDSINNIQNATAIANLQFNYQSEKEEKIRELQEAKLESEHAAEVKEHKIINRSIIAGLTLVLIFAGFIFRSLRITRKQKKLIEIKNEETEQQKKIIEEKQKDIIDSIQYAKRIQNALMPSEKNIRKILTTLQGDN